MVDLGGENIDPAAERAQLGPQRPELGPEESNVGPSRSTGAVDGAANSVAHDSAQLAMDHHREKYLGRGNREATAALIRRLGLGRAAHVARLGV